MKEEHINEIKAIIILSIGMILLASLISFTPGDLPWYTSSPNTPPHNLIKETGAYTAGILFFLFGYSAYFIVAFLFFWSWNKFSLKKLNFSYAKLIGSICLLIVISSLLSTVGSKDIAVRFNKAGIAGLMFSDFLLQHLGLTGTYIVLFSIGTLFLILTCEFLVTPLIKQLFEKIQDVISQGKQKVFLAKKQEIKIPTQKVKQNKLLDFLRKKEKEALKKEQYDLLKNSIKNQEQKPKEDRKEEIISKPADGAAPKIKIAPIDNEISLKNGNGLKIEGVYQIPPLDLLENPPQLITSKIQDDLKAGAKLLEDTLSQFGVIARVADIERGPAITRYELEPAPGMKVQQFTSLSDDIALAMRASVVRIVAPIPGKNRIGIEVPNQGAATVYLKDVLTRNEFRNSDSKLTLCLGKDISGKALVADLASMPHLLIAGTTGSGKTVCVNAIIMSMIFNATPDEVKFVLIDPKMVELAQYNDIPHLLCPTITDAKKTTNVLNWVVGEMESRYKTLSKEGVRNIKAYNVKGNKMPYIVVIIDELADLMQVSAKAVESSITRLAQLSRAVGIHLILATQRPSVDVITGVIKANFPARISFKVASKIDSRTVLDMNGAESLLGRGDMLFIQPGDAKPTRGQCCFVKDNEINKVIQFIKDQQAPNYDENIINHQKASGTGAIDEKDEYYDDAVKLIIETNQASVSILQRRMRLGYTRAARLIDMMEQNGIVGPYCGSKPRDILVDREQWLLNNMNDGNKEEDGK